MWWLPLLGQVLSSLLGGATTPKPPAAATQVPKFTQPTWYYPSLPKRESYITMTQPAADTQYQQMLAQLGEATKELNKQLEQSYNKRGLYESGLLSESQKQLANQQQKAAAAQAADIYKWQTGTEAQAQENEQAWRRQMAAAMAQQQMGVPAQQQAAAKWGYEQQAPYQQAQAAQWQTFIPEFFKWLYAQNTTVGGPINPATGKPSGTYGTYADIGYPGQMK